MRLVERTKAHPQASKVWFHDEVNADFETVRTELVRLRAALEEIDTMNPEDFKRGQEHLSPAFRTPNFADAFKFVCGVVNKVLHNTDAYGRPLPEEK